jgi:hypothetical protein
MSWRRGLFRAWLLLSVLWTAGYIYSCILTAPRLFWTAHPDMFWSRLLIAAPLPWLLTVAVFGLRWTIRGFRPNQDILRR